MMTLCIMFSLIQTIVFGLLRGKLASVKALYKGSQVRNPKELWVLDHFY